MEQSVLQRAASVVSVEDKSADRRETCSAGSRGETECRTSVETRTCHACALRRRYGTALKGSSGVCLAMTKKALWVWWQEKYSMVSCLLYTNICPGILQREIRLV